MTYRYDNIESDAADERLGDYYFEHDLWEPDEDEPAEVEADQDAVFTVVSDC